jgi:hypothetical protein
MPMYASEILELTGEVDALKAQPQILDKMQDSIR